MAGGVCRSFFLLLLLVLAVHSSGTTVGFSCDATREGATSSAIETISFLKNYKASPSQIRVAVTDPSVLDSISNAGLNIDLYLNETQVENLRKSKTSAAISSLLASVLPRVNVTSIIVGCSHNRSLALSQLPSILPILKSIHSTLRGFDLEHRVKVSVAFSISFLQNICKEHKSDLRGIVDFVKKSNSFIVVESHIGGELCMGDQFVRLMIETATKATTTLPYSDAPMVVIVHTSAVPSAVEVAEFSSKILVSVENNSRVLNLEGLFVEISPLKKSEREEMKWEEEQIFPSFHRELLNNFRDREPLSTSKTTTLRDIINPPPAILPTTPITNPVTTPAATIPAANPTPTIVTVPSTNPVTVTPMNPATTPVTVPSITPVTIPYTNPVVPPTPTGPTTNPITAPMTPPVTNPVTTYPVPPPSPSSIPVTTPVTTPPVTNPVTTYPVPPPSPSSIPVTTPVTTPPVNPVMPPPAMTSPSPPTTTTGQTWCVAKTGVLESALQAALDYACGIGAADCSVIQSTGSCYNPNTLQNHASYAFTSYYHKNPVPSSCDFGGTAMIVNTNPSTDSCVYPSSSPAAATTTYGSGSPPPVLNAGNPDSPSPVLNASNPGSPSPVLNASNPGPATTTIFGSEPPPGVSSSDPPGASASVSISARLQPLFSTIVLLIISIITGSLVKAA